MTKLYQIELSPAAQRQLEKLPLTAARSIIKKLEHLKVNPKPNGIKKLSGLDNLYRIRIGNYRVVYAVDNHILLILIVRVGDRKDVYRNL